MCAAEADRADLVALLLRRGADVLWPKGLKLGGI